MKLSATEIWITIVLLMLLVFAMRNSFLVLPRRFQPKGTLAEALGYAPLAALVAICAPEVARFQIDQLQQGASLSQLLAGVSNDWRLWGALALVVTMVLTRTSKRAALYGLAAAAAVVWAL